MRRQILFSAFILFFSLKVLSQSSVEIDNANYYKHFKDGASINWLRASDAVPIIIDELLKNGIAYHKISVGDLLKVNDSTRLVMTVTFDKDKKYGFLYESSHSLPLDPNDRNFLDNPQKAAYLQAENDLQGKVKFMRIAPLPSNVFLLKQTVYWFQFDNNGTRLPVSKEMAQNIIRQDIRKYLKSVQ
jgi:hypothetical protein